jgi:ABC-type transport system involved in multi-copper enzyme maturation permease subunit
MKRRRLTFGLPLLMRELSDQSGRARHYVLRVLFATGLLTIGFLYLCELVSNGSNMGSITTLGNGPALFNWIVFLEAIGIVVFLPALTCGAIAGEKERNTLPVLLTTQLGPATIAWEKLLSRLVLIFSLLLMSLPLLSFAYALGGLSLDYMIHSIVWLISLCVLVASLSLMCSAWSGSTVSAFFMTYSVGIALFVGDLGILMPSLARFYFYGGPPPSMQALLWGAYLPSAVFFLITVRCLVARASVTPRNFVLSFFRGLDRLYTRMNVVVGNIVLTRETNSLPDDRPIAWRETAKKSLGTVRYLVRILVAIEVPTIFLLLISAQLPSGLSNGGSLCSDLWLAVWCISTVLISVMCGGLICGEKTRQTLPVVLATPLPGAQILSETFAGVRRMIYVLWIPFFTIMVFDFWFHVGRRWTTLGHTAEWFLCSLLELTIYPFLIAWGTFYVGAKVRSPLWGIVTSLASVTAVLGVPWLLLSAFSFAAPFSYVQNDLFAYLSLASPASIVLQNESSNADFVKIAVNFLIYGGLLFLIRRRCLRNADRLLGRAEPQPAEQVRQTVSPIRDAKEMAPA